MVPDLPRARAERASPPLLRAVTGLLLASSITACSAQPGQGNAGNGGEGASSGAGGGAGGSGGAGTSPGPGNHVCTHQRADGNRLVAGKGTLPGADTIDVPLAGAPRWVVAATVEKATAWVVVLATGDVQAFLVDASGVTPAVVEPAKLPPSLPPVLRVDAAGLHLLVPPGSGDTASPPAPVDDAHLVFRDQNGDLVLRDAAEVGRLPLQLLPDARLCTDGEGRVAALARPTARYGAAAVPVPPVEGAPHHAQASPQSRRMPEGSTMAHRGARTAEKR